MQQPIKLLHQRSKKDKKWLQSNSIAIKHPSISIVSANQQISHDWKKRAPNDTEQEDKALCTAYVSASENPVKGTDQTGKENKYDNSDNS